MENKAGIDENIDSFPNGLYREVCMSVWNFQGFYDKALYYSRIKAFCGGSAAATYR
jgi:hypothetical protein